MNKKMFWLGLILLIIGIVVNAVIYGVSIMTFWMGGWMLWMFYPIGWALGIIGFIIMMIGIFGPNQKEMCWPWQKCWK